MKLLSALLVVAAVATPLFAQEESPLGDVADSLRLPERGRPRAWWTSGGGGGWMDPAAWKIAGASSRRAGAFDPAGVGVDLVGADSPLLSPGAKKKKRSKASLEASRERRLLREMDKPEDPDLLKRFDRNKDGRLDDAERLKMFKALGKTPYAGPGPSREKIRAKYDRNKDGKLDKAEIGALKKRMKSESASWRKLLKTYDKDGDRLLSSPERTAASGELGKAAGKSESGPRARFFKNPREFRDEIARNRIFPWLYAGLEADAEGGYEGGGAGNSWDAALSGGVELRYKRYITGRLVVAFNAHDVDYSLDEAVVRLCGFEKIPWFAEVGHSSVPFGEYDSHFKTDPQTQVLGEVEAWYASAGYDSNAGGASMTVFRGHDGAGDYDIVAHGEIRIVKGFDIGGSWTTDVSESLELRRLKQDLDFEEDERDFPHVASVMGASAFAAVETEKFDFDVEFVTALGTFRPGVLSEGAVRPWAFNIEGAVRPIDAWEIAVRFEVSRGIPEAPHYQAGIGTSYGFCKYASASVEFLYGIAGGGETDRPIVAAGLVLVF